MGTETGPLIIRIGTYLDVATAAAVIGHLRSADREREIVLEFAPDVECDTVALSFIAEAMERRRAPVSVRGISGHDARILRYLGVSLPGRSKEGA